MIAALVLGATLFSGVALGARHRVRATDGDRWRSQSGGTDGFWHILPRDVIVWKNPTDEPHDVSSYKKGKDWSFRTTLAPGESVSKRFRRQGSYYYRCRLHSTMDNGECSGMCGLIHVQR